MAGYVPTVPGVPPPMSYGQGYGNWQQYAGFGSTKNPYGGSAGYGVQPEDKNTVGVAPPAADTNIPQAPQEVKPDYGMPAQLPTPLGNPAEGQLGLKPVGQLGMSNVDVIKAHFGGM